MAILRRVGNLLSASLNDLLDGLEDPVTAANQVIRELEQAIQTHRARTAEAIATCKLTEKRLAHANNRPEDLQATLLVQQQIADELRQELHAMQEKVQEARRKRDTLLAKRHMAAVSAKSQQSSRKIRTPLRPEEIIDGFEALGKLEQRLDRAEAVQEAEEELSQELANRQAKNSKL